jgi:hypothetical protein
VLAQPGGYTGGGCYVDTGTSGRPFQVLSKISVSRERKRREREGAEIAAGRYLRRKDLDNTDGNKQVESKDRGGYNFISFLHPRPSLQVLKKLLMREYLVSTLSTTWEPSGSFF